MLSLESSRDPKLYLQEASLKRSRLSRAEHFGKERAVHHRVLVRKPKEGFPALGSEDI